MSFDVEGFLHHAKKLGEAMGLTHTPKALPQIRARTIDGVRYVREANRKLIAKLRGR